MPVTTTPDIRSVAELRSRSATPVRSRSATPVHHDKYYLRDGVIFLVENTLFRIPRYMLVQESPVFQDMFAIPTAQHPEGQTDTAPIQLLQVETTDFERLLAVIYPLRFKRSSTTIGLWGETEWRSVLHLATRWQMSEVRGMAIKQLTEHATPVSKVMLGRLYDYAPWIRQGFCNLSLRKEPLEMSEAVRLNLEDILGVAVARERMRTEVLPSEHGGTSWRETKYGSIYISSTHYVDSDRYSRNMMVHEILDDVFNLLDAGVENLVDESRRGSPA